MHILYTYEYNSEIYCKKMEKKLMSNFINMSCIKLSSKSELI